MTDPVSTNSDAVPTPSAATPAASSAASKPADSQQDPLAILEEILKKTQAKQKSPAGVGKPAAAKLPPAVGDDLPAAPAAPAPTEAEIAAQQAAELAAQQAAALEEQRLEAERQAQIEAQRQQLQVELPQTPAYRARVQQGQEKSEETAQQSQSGAGFQIRQLDHDKI